MGNKLKKLIMFLVVVLGMTLFANEEQKAPNEIIKDNPEREVTTVESMKVRDHATMSLSVTKKNEKVIEGELNGDRLKVKLPVKGINENTLDRMAKPKEGKRLVVESKSRINPRMAKMATKDIKKMPTQEEMNNLTVEQIQAMMSNTTGEKEEESQSKNIKNHIATENEEGVNLDILGVNKNENIYVNVEENGKVIDRYRVAIANSTPRGSAWIDSGSITGYQTDEVVALDNRSPWLIDKFNAGKGANITQLSSVVLDNYLEHLAFLDEFMNRGYDVVKINSSGVIGASFKLQRGNTNNVPLVKAGSITGSGIGASNLITLPAEQKELYSLSYDAIVDGTTPLYPGLFSTLKKGTNKGYFNSFKKAYLQESDKDGNLEYNNYITGKVTNVGFELAPGVNSNFPYPGVYTTAGFLETTYTTVDGRSAKVKAEYIKVDVGDEGRKYGSRISEGSIKKYTTPSNLGTTTTDFVELPQQGIQISFMKKSDNNLGLFYHDKINNQFIKLTPGAEQEIRYNQPNGSEQNVEQIIKIKVTQNQGQWAKVSYKIVNLKNPNASGNPQVIFEIVQGRKYGTSNNKITSLSEMRRARYTLNFNRIAESIGNLTTTIDPRLNQLTNHWITLGGNAHTDLGSLPANNSYTQLIGSIPNFTADKWIASISKVKKGNENYTSLGSYNKYERYGKNNTPYLAIKNIKSSEGYIIGTEDLTTGNNFARKIADTGTLKIEVRAKNGDDISFDHIMNEAGENIDKTNFTNNEGYKGSGSIDLTRKKVEHEYTLSRPQWDANETDNILHINNISGYVTIFAGLVEGQKSTEIVDSYKISVGTTELGTVTFGTNNQGVTTNDGALKIKLVKTGDVNNKRNIKLTKLEDIDFDKNIKIEYYHKSGIKLGEFTLRVTNTRTVTSTGTLTTTIDPRLAKLTTEEWITLGNYSGGTDLTNLSPNKYFGLIKATTNELNPPKTIKEIEEISKNNTEYPYISGDKNKYKRYGTNNNPLIAILTTKNDGNIADTKDLHTNANFARKVRDQGSIKFEFQAGDKYYYSFNHNLAVEPNPTTNSEEFTAEKGYIGETSVDLTGKEIDKTYTLNRNGASGNYEINISGAITSGWMPTLHGLFDKTQNIADYYKINSGSEIKFGNANNGVDITENGATLFNIKLIKPTDTQDKKNVQIIKRKDVDFSKTVKIEYYHSSGIKLGEFTVNVSNTKTVTPIGSMSNEIDPRLVQKSNEWISLAGYGHENIGELEANRYSEFISVTNDKINNGDKQRTIISINEVKKGNAKYVEISNSTTNKDYARYGTSNTPLLGIKKKDNTLVENTNIGTDISELTGTNFFVRKISDTGEVSVEFVATNKNNYSFTHSLVKASAPTEKPNKFTENNGYIGSANVNLSGKDLDTPYTLVENSATAGEINMESVDGWLPTFGGIVSDYSDTVIVDHYKINNSSNIAIDGAQNTGYNFDNFNIKLIKPTDVDNKKNIIITKKNDNTYDTPVTVLIEYYHSSGIKLGEFTLTVNNTRTEKELGESTVNIDPRIVQVSDDYSWIDLKNGDMFQLTTGTKAGNYTDFIGIPSAFPNAQNHSSYNEFNLEYVIELNDSTSLTRDFYTYNGTKYTILSGNNEAGIPTNIKLKDFVKVDNSSKLVISKFDVTKSDHTKNNKFLISGRSGNQIVAFKGNIKEVYLNKEGKPIADNQAISENQNIFSGSGTLNLAPATVGDSYWFAKTGSGELKGNGNSNEIILKLGLNSDPLNAAGIITKSKNKRVANKMIVTVDSKEETINLNGGNLEKELTIGKGKVKIAIDNTGKLVVTKTQEGNIPSTPIEIKYYYKPSTNISTNEIHLGTFTLTVENPVVEIGTRNVKVDKRFVDKDGYNWLLGNNTAKRTINDNTTSSSFTSLFKYEGNFRNLETDTIERALRVDNRPVRGNAPSNADYLDFIVGTGVYQDEAAVLNKGTINELTNKVIVSKYNGPDSSLTNNGLLNNKFYILAKDSNDKYKIYTGNVTEEIVGNGVISGTGSVIFRAINNGKTYTFNPGAGGSATATTDNTTMTITVNQGGKLLDGRGQSNIQSGNIANKITVSKDGNISGTGNSATVDGITFGISSTGGLTINNSNSVSLTKDTTYTIKFYYSAESVDVELSTFNLTVKKTEAEDVGDIEFEVDPRLVKISSVDSGSVKWMSGDKMFGSWDTKEDYSNVIYTNNKITNTTIVDYVDTVVGKFRGTGTDYTVFKTAETGGYNIIAFKTGVALNNYLSEKNLMLSPADDQTFETIFEGTDGNKYKAEIILTHATGVSQEGYSGSGVLDISNGIKGTEYLFSAPTNTKTSTTNGLSMAVTDDFPNTNGVVTGKKSTSIADSVVVTVNGATVTPEIDSNVIGNQIYKVNNDLKVGLTSNNQIKIIKLAREFNYTGNNKIVIEYKYRDVKLGVFNLEINSDLTEVDLGTLDVKIDNRIIQLSDDHSWIRLDGQVMVLDSGTNIGNYKEFIKVGNWSQGASATGYNANDKIKVIEKINDRGIDYRPGIYARIQTKNEAAFPEKETTSSNHILASSFIQTGQGTKLLVSKWDVTNQNSSSEKHDGKNEFYAIGTKGESEIEVAYKGNVQEKYVDRDGTEKTILTGVKKEETVYKGSGSINLASAEIGTPYSFTKGASGNISSTPKITNGRDQNSLLNLVVSNGEKNIDPTSMFSSKKIANILKVSVNGGTTETIKGTMESKLETEALTIGDGKVKIGIDTSGDLLITKIEEGNIPETVINITYYYSPDPNNDSKEKIELGTFTLTVENPIMISDTEVTVEIDKRFESLEGYNWLFNNGEVSSEIKPKPTDKTKDFSNFFGYNGSLKVIQGTIIKDLRMSEREVKNSNNASAEYGYYQLTGKTGSKGEGAIPRIGDMSQLNELITVSKGNDPNDPRSLENEFSLLFTDSTNGNRYSIYRGKIIEKIKGNGKYIGAGKIKEKDLTQNTKYIFSTKTNKMGTITSDNENVSIVEASGMPVNALGVVSGKETEVVANKIIVKYKEENENGTITENTTESTGNLNVTLTGLTVGIDSTGGLTLQKTQDKTNITEVVINYLYEGTIGSEKKTVDLGEFTLTIEKDTITIDPDDAFLDFGDMVYHAKDGGLTLERRTKTFIVENTGNLEIEFSTDKESKMLLKNNPKEELKLQDIEVKKKSNTSFELGATAVLNKDTQSGSYEGTIEVIVDIITPSNP